MKEATGGQIFSEIAGLDSDVLAILFSIGKIRLGMDWFPVVSRTILESAVQQSLAAKTFCFWNRIASFLAVWCFGYFYRS